MFRPIRFAPLLLTGALLAPNALAAVFPDVPDGHVFQEPIEQLNAAGVVGGNPDGTFAPNRSVNRAEMLKMLYLAGGRTPDRSSVRCFPDVVFGSWYESYVCDASVRKFVGGYPNGTFRPGEPVNRVEALKMIQLVLEIPVEEMTESSRSVLNFVDISTSAWYTKYLASAYKWGILPIAGQDQSHFFPERELTRGEAAAMIYNAQNASLRSTREESEEEEDADASSSVASVDEEDAVEQVPETDFPFEERGKFNGKRNAAHTFLLSAKTVISIKAALQSGQQGEVGCVLHRLTDDGFVYEYYLGVQEDNECEILVALEPGTYQISLQPGTADSTYEVTGSVATGDNNDGFSQAKALKLNQATTVMLSPGNTANWYSFSVTEKNGSRLNIELSDADNFLCMVYPLKNVDVYGFQMPQCNQFTSFPKGDYMLGIYRKSGLAVQLTYTLILRN